MAVAERRRRCSPQVVEDRAVRSVLLRPSDTARFSRHATNGVLHAATFGLAVGDGDVVRTVLRACRRRRGPGDARGERPRVRPGWPRRTSVFLRAGCALASPGSRLPLPRWKRTSIPSLAESPRRPPGKCLTGRALEAPGVVMMYFARIRRREPELGLKMGPRRCSRIVRNAPEEASVPGEA